MRSMEKLNSIITICLLSAIKLTLAAPSPETSPAQRIVGRPFLASSPNPSFAALPPLQPVPYNSESKDKEVRLLPCRTGAGGGQAMMGSYRPVTAVDEKNGMVNDLAPVAWQNFTHSQAITGCVPNSVHPVSFNVTEACKQLVAGTNYAFEFEAFFDCATQQRAGAFGSVTLDAIVYLPLQAQGENTGPQVRSVWNVTKA